MCSDILLIAGYSFGGMVAYEMASELKRNNETVAMVFMVDTYAWFPESLPNCSGYIKKYAEVNLKSRQKLVVNIHKSYFLSVLIHFSGHYEFCHFIHVM